MNPSSHRAVPLRGLVAALAAALIPVIAGCEAGGNAPVLQWHQPTPGAQAVVNKTIRINNMFVLGPAPGADLPAGSSAAVFLALANEGAPDHLVGMSAPGTAAAVALPSGGVALGSGQSVLLTGPVPRVALRGLARPLAGGQSVKMVLTFANAGSKTLHVPVMPRAQYYTAYSPAPSPSPTPTPSGRHKHKHNKSAPSPSASPSPTPTPS